MNRLRWFSVIAILAAGLFYSLTFQAVDAASPVASGEVLLEIDGFGLGSLTVPADLVTGKTYKMHVLSYANLAYDNELQLTCIKGICTREVMLNFISVLWFTADDVELPVAIDPAHGAQNRYGVVGDTRIHQRFFVDWPAELVISPEIEDDFEVVVKTTHQLVGVELSVISAEGVVATVMPRSAGCGGQSEYSLPCRVVFNLELFTDSPDGTPAQVSLLASHPDYPGMDRQEDLEVTVVPPLEIPVEPISKLYLPVLRRD